MTDTSPESNGDEHKGDGGTPPIEVIGACQAQQCDKPVATKGLCSAHYQQQRHGKRLTPLRVRRKQRPRGTPPQLDYAEAPCPNPILQGPCHISTSYKTDGYAIEHYQGKKIYLHRYVWEQRHGQIPPGLVIDHQCRNRACINMLHLRLVTYQVNVTENAVGTAWQREAAKIHCPQGHAYNDENTDHRKDGKRRCRICHREQERRRTAQRGK